eukprot:scaffold82393_cov63-Phaeocystis_antarctica.AAC.8
MCTTSLPRVRSAQLSPPEPPARRSEAQSCIRLSQPRSTPRGQCALICSPRACAEPTSGVRCRKITSGAATSCARPPAVSCPGRSAEAAAPSAAGASGALTSCSSSSNNCASLRLLLSRKASSNCVASSSIGNGADATSAAADDESSGSELSSGLGSAARHKVSSNRCPISASTSKSCALSGPRKLVSRRSSAAELGFVPCAALENSGSVAVARGGADPSPSHVVMRPSSAGSCRSRSDCTARSSPEPLSRYGCR